MPPACTFSRCLCNSGISARESSSMHCVSRWPMDVFVDRAMRARVDGGTSFGIQTNTDVTSDMAVVDALSQIYWGAIRSNALEYVDETSLEVSATSGEANPANGYVTPSDFAVVIAKDVNNSGNMAQLSIPLRGVAVGVPQQSIWIQSGATSSIAAWVTGSANKAYTCSMN